MAPEGSGTDGVVERDGHAEVVMVLTVTDDRAVAARLAESAVGERLAACTQLEGPVVSSYRWEGELCSDEEWRVVAKTTAGGAAALVEHWEEIHPYDVPEILVVEVAGGHEPYLRWVGSEVVTGPG